MKFNPIHIFLCFFLLQAGSYGQTFKVGVAMRNITPDPLISVSGGLDAPLPTTQKLGELTVRAMVMEKGKVRIAMVSIDNLGWPAGLGDISRSSIKGILPENILLSSTHTHSAPDAYAYPDEKGHIRADTIYLKWAATQIADAVNEAKKNLVPANLRIAVGKAADGIAYNYYAPKLYDPRCGVIQALNTSNEVIATLVNFAIHPEIIGNEQGILSPDLCGPLYKRIEERTGGMAFFFNGALGGMITADNRRADGKKATDWKECERIGHLLADEALRIVNEGEIQRDPVLICTHKTLQFPIDSPSKASLLSNAPYSRKFIDNGHISSRINLLEIGSAKILTIPGEALPNIGFYLKRKMKTEHAFLFGLTNDAFGYMMTKVDFMSFDRYKYISEVNLGEMTGEIYIEGALELMDAGTPQEIKTE